jgi:4'-phosphopantetheinyl transferase
VSNLGHPEVFRVFDTADVRVLGAWLDLPELDCTALGSLLSPAERRRAERFRSPIDRRHYIVARGRLRQLLSEQLRIEPEAIDITTNEQGKPKLGPAQSACGLEFNMSHSASLAIYAIARDRVVGVDIEQIRHIPDTDDLAARFFSAAEADAYRAMPTARRNLAFLACWTRKEAFVKALGEGLSHPLDSFDVTIDPDEPAQIARIGERTGQNLGWSMACFRPTPFYIGALVHGAKRDGGGPGRPAANRGDTWQSVDFY